MTTSLQEQLRRLAVPQTAELVDSRSKASLLFERKEAATKSRRTIYDIGVAGLQELAAINPIFLTFQSTLFDESTINLERAVEHSDINKILDGNINKFLQQLSPYFMLRSSLMCLEWLVRRFHIEEYNRKELLALAFPYHETNAFVTVLQAIRIRKDDKEWSWLKPLQRAGVPVPKLAIINRAASDAAFLKFVCQSTVDTMKELGTRANSLQTQLNFYTHIVIGALENATGVTERHIITILPSLLKGLKSETLDFLAASYIIATQLVARTQVTSKLCNALIERAINVPLERLRETAVTFIIFIFDCQQAANPKFSEASLLKIVQKKWFTSILATLAKDRVCMHFVCASLLQAAVAQIQKGDTEVDSLKQFVGRLLDDVEFEGNTAQEIIHAFLNAFTDASAWEKQKRSFVDNDTIELSSDEEMPEKDSNFIPWYSDTLRKLERKYPESFDLTIKECLKSNETHSASRRVLKIALGFRLKSVDVNATDIYENLYHHTAKIRAMAVQVILENLHNYREIPQNQQLLKECLADRVSDESELVVTEILKLPTETFIQILGCEKLANALFDILYKIQQNPEHWAPLTIAVIRHLTSQQVVELLDANIILLALMPQLFPDDSSSTTRDAIIQILQSSLVEKLVFLKQLRLTGTESGSEFNASNFKKQFFDVITTHNKTPTALQLCKSIESYGNELFRHSLHFAYFLVLATAFLKDTISSADGAYIFEQMSVHYKRFRVRHFDSNQRAKEKHFIPLVLFSDFIIALTQHTKFQYLQNWEQSSTDLRTFLSIVNLLVSAAFSKKNEREQLEWLKLLKDVFGKVFENAQAKFIFLTNFYIYEKLAIVEDYNVLRIRAFKMMNALLRNKNNKFTFTTEYIFKVCIALNSLSEVIRQQTLETIQILKEHDGLEETQKYFLESIWERNHEIRMDHEQFPLILHTILKPAPKKQKGSSAAKKVLYEILHMVTATAALDKADFIAEVLKTMKHINDEIILCDLIPLAMRSLDQTSKDNALTLLKKPHSTIFRSICERFEYHVVENVLLDRPEAWQLIERVFANYAVFIPQEDKLESVVCIFLKAFDEQCYEKISHEYKVELIKLIIKTGAAADNDSISLAANKLFKKCVLQGDELAKILEKMCGTSTNESLKKQQPLSISSKKGPKMNKAQIQVNSPTWKEGMVLLELLENKKKLRDSEKLIPGLFEVLRFCLEVEDHTSVEYTKQLTLSIILHCCQLAQADNVDLLKALPKTTFRIDLIVQCVRGTQNPQTQHNALLLLSHCATLFPQDVLHNIVDVFTFMGSSVVRQDDAFSFHILNKVIESIIPILVQKKRSQTTASKVANTHELVIPVLKVFSDILLDVPEHRRLALYSKLLHTLRAEQYLYIFLCIVFEGHILDDEKQRLLLQKGKPAAANMDNKLSKRIEICLELTNSFEPQVTLETCIQLLDYIKSLPLHKDIKTKRRQQITSAIEATEISLFDVECRTAKQLRHYKFVIMHFLSIVSNSTEFLRKIALLSDEDQLVMKPYYQNFIIKTLSYVPIVTAAIEKAEEAPHTKFWKMMLHHVQNVLDNAISLLSPDMFLVVVLGLLQHQLLTVRKKVIEILITKMQQRDSYFEGYDPENFYNLLKPLSEIACSIRQSENSKSCADTDFPAANNELLFLQQTSLIAIKLLSKMFALQRIEEFKELLGQLNKILKNRAGVSKILLAAVVLTIVEISSNLKAHSLAFLPKYMPQMVAILQDQTQLVREQPPDNVCVAIITGIQKLFESLPLFLGPYVVDIITVLSSISAYITAQHNEKDQRSMAALNRISMIWSRIASDVPLRILVPSCEKSYKKLMPAQNYADIGVLMRILPECFSKTTGSDLAAVQNELNAFFLHTLEFRLQVQQNCSEECISNTETVIIDAYVAWVLKLSESSFRPVFHKVYEWAIKQNGRRETILTFFVLTNKIAQALKSLFVLFARDFIDDIAKLLNVYNSIKETIDSNDEKLTSDIIKAIFNTLYNLFLYDNKGFINSQRFEMLMPPLIDQLENRLVLENEELQKALLTSIAQLAVAVSSDIMWKQLNYQVLMKTRANVPEVRILSFNCNLEIARKLGEDFTPLLPETVPFIAELLEDENQRVEKNTRKAVQELEGILGESLQNYL